MKAGLLAVSAAALMVAACGSNDNQAMVATDAPASTGTVSTGSAAGGVGTGAETPNAAGPGTALGLTQRQLEDADLKDRTGRDLGDVEGVVTDGSGAITHLLVEIDDTSPDRYVHVPISGLTALRDGDDWDVQGDLTREQLLAMPAVQR